MGPELITMDMITKGNSIFLKHLSGSVKILDGLLRVFDIELREE